MADSPWKKYVLPLEQPEPFRSIREHYGCSLYMSAQIFWFRELCNPLGDPARQEWIRRTKFPTEKHVREVCEFLTEFDKKQKEGAVPR